MLPTQPVQLVSKRVNIDSASFTYSGDMALCNLSSINLAHWITLTPRQKQDFMYLLVKSMDNAIDTTSYSNELGKLSAEKYRPLGIGVSNYAYTFAQQSISWSSAEARYLTHSIFEQISFYAIKASIQLAKERSRFPTFNQTKWADNIFPHELSILPDKFKQELTLDWESLRAELSRYGIRNATLLACAPTSTSGKCINATPGIDAPKQLKSIEEGTYSLPFTVPGLREYRDSYETLFTINNRDTIELAAIRQRFICMSQSVSLAYIDTSSAYRLISDVMYAEELGIKALYYTHSQKGEIAEVCDSCGS